MRRRYLAVVANSVVVFCVMMSMLTASSATWAQEATPKSTTDMLLASGTGFGYQGELHDSNGPVTGTCDLRFSLHDAPTGGNQVGDTQTISNVVVTGGRFSVVINGSNEFGSTAFTGDARWLQVSVRCPAGSGDFSVLTPLQELLPVPYALYASTTPWMGIAGIPADLADGDADTTYAAGNGLTLSSGTFAVLFEGNGVANSVARSDHNHGDQNWTGPYSIGLAVQNTSTISNADALWGGTASPTGNGVYGENTSTARKATGIVGIALDSEWGVGVLGKATGVGVYGYNESSTGWGVYGYTDSTVGTPVGVYGTSYAPDGKAVFGYNRAESGGVAVFGQSNSNGGWAGYFEGDVNVTGTMYAESKEFRIDHPLDPEDKYLNHASVESSEMLNVYSGNAKLDSDGTALVRLPEWFEALNTDFRYQLTPIGAPAPNLHVAQPIAHNQFEIAGGAPGMSVSWQVTGVRHDPYALANPLVVEKAKPAGEQGTYLSPGPWGQPEAKAALYQDRQDMEEPAEIVNSGRAGPPSAVVEPEGD